RSRLAILHRQRVDHDDVAGVGAGRQCVAQSERAELLRQVVRVVARQTVMRMTTATEDRGVRRAVTRLARTLLLVELRVRARDFTTRLRFVRARTALGELVLHHAMQDVFADFLDAEDRLVEIDRAALLAIECLNVEFHVRPHSAAACCWRTPAGFGASFGSAAFAASRTSTQPPSAPGTAPRTNKSPRSASTRTICRF